jgi:hypothetical protein
MKSVLMICYWFAPEGNAATYRPLRFVRCLESEGWRASVMTLDARLYERYDPSLLALVPEETEIVRVPRNDPWRDIQERRAGHEKEVVSRREPQTVAARHARHHGLFRSRLREFVRSVEAWSYHPDMAMGWIRPAVKAAVEFCGRKRPDVIWATGAPWSSFIIAQRISEQTRIPYVLDFRSSWTLVPNEFEARRPGWAERHDRLKLRRLFEEAQAVTFFYETEAECYWNAYPGALDISKIHIIPNGYEGKIEQIPFPESHRCTILYTGTAISYRYDAFLRAIHNLKESDPALAGRLRVTFLGEGAEYITKEASALDISDIVEVCGPTSQAQAEKRQKEAHALLILGRPPDMRGYELLAGAKVFGYLKAGRPIIGVLPCDETRKVLQHVGVSTVASPDSVDEIMGVLRKVLHHWSAGTLSKLVPIRTACEAYSAERQTAVLARALEGLMPEEPFTPGKNAIPPSLREVVLSRTTPNRSGTKSRELLHSR